MFPLKEPNKFSYNANTFYELRQGGRKMHKRWKCQVLALNLVMGMLCGCAQRSTPAVLELPTRELALAKTLEFPITLQESRLVVEKLMCYNGPYWEDGSGEIVENVAGLMLYNPTDRLIEFAAFSLEQEGKQLYFFVYHLPPQSRCLVLEYHKNACDPGAVTACTQLSIRWGYQELSREQMDYVGLGPLMTVINRDTRRLKHVTVWYKRYVQSEDYYLGGAVYSAHVFDLQPEEQRTISPEYYEAGSARIVGIELEM